MHDNDKVAMRLDLIAAKAKLLSSDLKNKKLWEGDLVRGIGEIINEAQKAQQEARTDR